MFGLFLSLHTVVIEFTMNIFNIGTVKTFEILCVTVIKEWPMAFTKSFDPLNYKISYYIYKKIRKR
jgi:hypothetical protein